MNMNKKKILFDTDIGSDIDDAVCLSYLLANPQAEIVGITTVSGQPTERAELASCLCIAAGKPDIPIYPGCAYGKQAKIGSAGIGLKQISA